MSYNKSPDGAHFARVKHKTFTLCAKPLCPTALADNGLQHVPVKYNLSWETQTRVLCVFCVHFSPYGMVVEAGC